MGDGWLTSCAAWGPSWLVPWRLPARGLGASSWSAPCSARAQRRASWSFHRRCRRAWWSARRNRLDWYICWNLNRDCWIARNFVLGGWYILCRLRPGWWAAGPCSSWRRRSSSCRRAGRWAGGLSLGLLCIGFGCDAIPNPISQDWLIVII